MEADLNILQLEANGCTHEVALDHRGEMALTAWIEAAPSRRRVRSSIDTVRKYWKEDQATH